MFRAYSHKDGVGAHFSSIVIELERPFVLFQR